MVASRLLAALVLLGRASARDWRTAAFWPDVFETLQKGRLPTPPAPRRCILGAFNATGCRAAILLPATYRESAASLESQAAVARALHAGLGHPVAVLVVTEPPYDAARIRHAFREHVVHIRELADAERRAQDRLPFWLRQWYKHAVAVRMLDHLEAHSRHPVDVIAKFRFDSHLVFRDDAAILAMAMRSLAEPDALWAQIEMQWWGAAAVARTFLDALLTDAREPEAYELVLNGTRLRRWDAKPTKEWFDMMAASDLMFPGYGEKSLDELRNSGDARRWVRTKPSFWPGVSSEELFVGAALRHDLVIKDLTAAPGVKEATWNKDWMRWVEVDGCKLGNVVKLDGNDDVATYGAAARDCKLYPTGKNATRGRFNAYFARNLTDADLGAVVSARVARENPTCAETSYVFGDGMLERIYPGFWGAELEATVT